MERYLPTGNEMISLPKINENTAGIEDFTYLSMQHKGLIEVRGSERKPLIAPFVQIGDERIPLSDMSWTRKHYWIPYLTAKVDVHDFTMEVLTPIGERGFAMKLAFKAASDVELRWGLEGRWDSSWHCVNEDKKLDGKAYCYESNWNHSLIFDFRCGSPVFAFAPMCKKEIKSEYSFNGDSVNYTLSRCDSAKQGET